MHRFETPATPAVKSVSIFKRQSYIDNHSLLIRDMLHDLLPVGHSLSDMLFARARRPAQSRIQKCCVDLFHLVLSTKHLCACLVVSHSRLVLGQDLRRDSESWGSRVRGAAMSTYSSAREI